MSFSGLDRPDFTAYNIVAKQFGGVQDTDLQEIDRLITKGLTASHFSNKKKAVSIYASVVERYGDVPDAAIRSKVGTALLHAGIALTDLNQTNAALATYDEIGRRFADSEEHELRGHVARSLLLKASALCQAKRWNEALRTYDELISKVAGATETDIRELAAFGRARALAELGGSEEAIPGFESLAEKFGDSENITLQEFAASAQIEKASLLHRDEEDEESLAVLDELLIRFRSILVRDSQMYRSALLLKVDVLISLRRPEETFSLCDEILQKFSEAEQLSEETYFDLATVMLNRANALLEIGRIPEALAAYEAFDANFEENPQPAIQVLIAKSLLARAVHSCRSLRPQDALGWYSEIVRRFGVSDDLELRRMVTITLTHECAALILLKRHSEALELCCEVAAREIAGADDDDNNEDGSWNECTAQALHLKCLALHDLARDDEELAAFDEMITRFAGASHPKAKEYAARACLGKAVRLGQIGRLEEEIAALDQVLQRLAGTSRRLALDRVVATTLGVKGLRLGMRGLVEESIRAYNELIHRFAHAEDADLHERVIEAFINKSVALRGIGRFEDELRACDDALALFGHRQELPVRQRVADFLLGKAQRLDQLGRPDESIAMYREVVARLGDAWELSLQEPVSVALTNLGDLYRRLGLDAERIHCCDELVHRFAQASHLILRVRAAEALTVKGIVVGRSHPIQGVEIYEQVVQHFGDDNEPDFRRAVASALLSKAAALYDLKRFEESIAALEDLTDRFSAHISPEIEHLVLRAFHAKGVRLLELGRDAEALATYDSLKQLFANTPPSDILLLALVNGCELTGRIRGFDKGLEAYDELIKRFGQLTGQELDRPLSMMFMNKGVALGKLERNLEAVQAYTEIIQRFAHSRDPEVRRIMIKTAYFRAIRCGKLNRLADQIQSYDECLRLSAEHPDSAWLRNMVANTTVRKGLALVELGRHEEAIPLYDEVARRFCSPELAVNDEIAKALVSKGIALRHLGRDREAATIFDDVANRFSGSIDPLVQAQVSRAEMERANLTDLQRPL